MIVNHTLILKFILFIIIKNYIFNKIIIIEFFSKYIINIFLSFV